MPTTTEIEERYRQKLILEHRREWIAFIWSIVQLAWMGWVTWVIWGLYYGV